MRKKILSILLIISITIIVAIVVINLNNAKKNNGDEGENRVNIVASFYPTYILTLNIADGIPGINISNLTDYSSGCLHDYQITTDDMKTLSKADILVINGGGMENFIEDAINSYPDLIIVDASHGIEFIKDENHSHNHGHSHNEDAEEDHEAHSGENQEKHSDENHKHNEANQEDYIYKNSHIWLNPLLYIRQIENVRDSLIEFIEKMGIYNDDELNDIIATMKNNASTYIDKVIRLDEELTSLMESNIDKLYGEEKEEVVIFHDAFLYLAERMGLEVAYTVEMDTDTYLSAGEIAEIIDIIDEHDIKYLLTELQYSDSIAKRIEEETGARVYIIDSAVTGDGTKDSYLTSMYHNIDVLKDALQ